MAAFTHYWTNQTCDDAVAAGWEGAPLDHTAGKGFKRRGVREGDRVYVVTVRQGRLFLIGRMTVERVLYSDEEARRVLGYEPWSAPEHLIATAHDQTPQRFDREVRLEVVRALRVETADGQVPLVFRSEGELDQQTLRGIRKLTPGSAASLNTLLD